MVAELLRDGQAWNEPILEQLFPEHVRSCILNTPIGERGSRDKMCWTYDDKGLFSVKSAYLVAVNFYEPDPNCSAPDRKVWSRLVWNVSIPPKAKVFMWRAMRNFIPSAANLKRHHVPTTGICSLCFDRWGSTEHALLFCPKVVAVWKASSFWDVVNRAEGLELIDVTGAVLKEKDRAELALWSIMLWQVWVYVGKLLHPSNVVPEQPSEGSCVAILESFQSAMPTFVAASRLGVELGAKKWRRPRPGSFRVDVDAKVDRASHIHGVGIVVRNDRGELVLAIAKRTSPSSSIMMAEIMAIIHGVVACVEHGIQPIEIFTDSLLAVRLMADPDEERRL